MRLNESVAFVLRWFWNGNARTNEHLLLFRSIVTCSRCFGWNGDRHFEVSAFNVKITFAESFESNFPNAPNSTQRTHSYFQQKWFIFGKIAFYRAFGMTMLVMLASCLLHLVASSYFLFFDVLGDPVATSDSIFLYFNFWMMKTFHDSDSFWFRWIVLFDRLKQDWYVASLQLLWCCFHVSRLLLIVEPCHMATSEVSSCSNCTMQFRVFSVRNTNIVGVSYEESKPFVFRQVKRLRLCVKQYGNSSTPPLSLWWAIISN